MQVGGSAQGLFEGLQVAPHPQLGHRPDISAFTATQDIPAAFAKTSADPQYGGGGLDQIYIPDISALQLVNTTPLIK